MIDLEKFEGFMKNYQDMVYTTAVRLLGNETDAQDIAQTVFLKAFQAFGELEQSPTVGGWLKTVTTNLCLNQLTRYRFRWRFFSEMRTSDEGPDFVETVPVPDEHEPDRDAADRRRLLEMALQKIPATQRVPLVLFHYEDLAYDQIAERLGISLSKVKTDIHRGRLALKRYLQPRLSDEDRFNNRPVPPDPQKTV